MSATTEAKEPVTTTGLQPVSVRVWTARGPRMSWARITLDDTNGIGSVTVDGDHGRWGFNWPLRNRGTPDLAVFLAGCDSGYLAGKFGAEREYDEDATAEHIKRHILDHRRDAGMWAEDAERRGRKAWTKARAREEWDLVESALPDGFDNWYQQTTIDDAWEFRSTVENRAWTRFYETFWEAFRADVRKSVPRG
jgi:hypothetical protein